MKKVLRMLLVIYITAISSCSKNEEKPAPAPPDKYFKFTVNDSLITHAGLTVCSLRPNSTIPGSYEFLLSSNTNTSAVTMGLYKTTMITTGTYTIAADPASISAEYYIDQGLTMYSLHTTLMPPAPFSITLSEITDTYVKGTFSGVHMYNETRTDSLRVTNGQFLVRRSR